MRLILLFGFALALGFSSCKEKKISLAGDMPVQAADFVEFFPELSLSYRLSDTLLEKAIDDSMLIAETVFAQFVPDSVLDKEFTPPSNIKLHALGKAQNENKEYYLFIKASKASKKIGFVLVFNEKKEFMAAMPLVKADNDKSTSSYGVFDRRYVLNLTNERVLPGGQMIYKKDVYVFNSAGNFNLILTETNELSATSEDGGVFNPIDTFPSKNKYSGNYGSDKKNFISVRDGEKPGEFLFFIHFEKSNGTCVGELKGKGIFTGKTTGQYRGNNDPCFIEFNFRTNGVSFREVEGCGAYRGIKCFFESSFPKKKS